MTKKNTMTRYKCYNTFVHIAIFGSQKIRFAHADVVDDDDDDLQGKRATSTINE